MSNINERADGFPKENAGGKINTTGLLWIKKDCPSNVINYT